MKILQIASGDFFSTYGGGQVYVKNIVDEMIRSGADITALSFVPKVGGSDVEYKVYKEASLVEIHGEVNFETLLDIVRKISPDIIHAHSHKAQMCLVGKELNIPVVVTAHHGGIVCPAGTLMNYKDEICRSEVSHSNCLRCCLRGIRSGEHWYPFMKYLSEGAYAKLGTFLKHLPFIPFLTPIGQVACNIKSKQSEWQTIVDNAISVVAPCNEIATAMIRYGLDAEKISVIPHGIPRPKEELVSETKIGDNGRVRLFFVGRIARIKGLHVLLEAFEGCKSENIELHIIGGAGNKQEQHFLSDLMKKYSDDKRIIWHGKVSPDRVFETISRYDVMVHPAIFLEIFGLTISESLAMGKPVLATRCGGAEMQIEDGVNGWLVEPNSVEAMRCGIVRAVQNYRNVSNVGNRVIFISEHCGELQKLYSEQ